MNRSQKLIFAVTNDLSYDQRMIRICSSLASHGYHVTLVGRKVPLSIDLIPMPFQQFRIKCFFNKGFTFYAEFNIRLFFYLLFKKAKLVCAVDLDTILACYLISLIKNIPRVYDAHELFCEMKEVVTRPRIYRFWKKIERFAVPRFKHGYTVNNLIAKELMKDYGVNYETIRNLPYKAVGNSNRGSYGTKRFILYQGAVNEGRCFETIIPAFNSIDAELIICGDGNFMQQAKQIVKENDLEHKIQFKGLLAPALLKTYTEKAYAGVNIIEKKGRSNQLSLSNRFFDYIQSALPQVCVDYPAYRQINDEFNCAYLISDTNTETISAAINTLLNDEQLYHSLHQNCVRAARIYNWNQEEPKLLSFYKNIFDRA
jgi:glycosyltransferase involved in cell wall biosynthesis